MSFATLFERNAESIDSEGAFRLAALESELSHKPLDGVIVITPALHLQDEHGQVP